MSENLPEVNTTDSVLTLQEQEIIEQTINGISIIFAESALSTHEKVGEYILEKIFEQDSEAAWEINDENSANPKTVLFRHFQDEIIKIDKEKRFPKKTWFYNAVNVALDKKRIQNAGYLERYNSLNVSIKIELLKISNIDEKIQFIEKITKDNLSVRAARKLLGSVPIEKNLNLFDYIRDPSLISDVNKIPLPRGKKRKINGLEAAKKTILLLNEEISNKRRDLENLEKLIAKLENTSSTKDTSKQD